MRVLVVLMVLGLAGLINGHGWLQNPPARNSMWRFGFKNPKNYNDNEQFCGGAFVMAKLKGRCGLCGDQYGKAQTHADGGKYANGIIVRSYKQGDVIDVSVLLTKSHYGYFEFRIGDFTNKQATGNTIGKLDGHLLELESGGTRFKVTESGRYLYKTKLRLPKGLKCQRCVMQWWYKGGNNWGCDHGKCGQGRGTQEHFVNCADVKVE